MNNQHMENALKAVPAMEELSDESLRAMMGGWSGGYCTITCECGCTLCTSTIYSCTREVIAL